MRILTLLFNLFTKTVRLLHYLLFEEHHSKMVGVENLAVSSEGVVAFRASEELIACFPSRFADLAISSFFSRIRMVVLGDI